LSMSGPNAFRAVLLAVDDDPEDLERVERERGKRYGTDYRVACESSACSSARMEGRVHLSANRAGLGLILPLVVDCAHVRDW
jgi:hypothetical protein